MNDIVSLIKFGLLILSLCFISIGGLTFCSTPPSIQTNKAQLTKKYKEDMPVSSKYSSIIRLYRGESFLCSAVVIDANYALTAAHCIVNSMFDVFGQTITATDSNNTIKKFNVMSVGYSQYQDVALLKGNFSAFYTSPVDFDGVYLDVMRGQAIKSCGFPGGGALFCTDGRLLGNQGFLLKGQCGILQKGMSGGPVFDYSSGQVIGVNSAVCETGQLFGPVLGIDAVFGIRK